MIIAIDGPAGAGKSTVAKYVSQKLGMTYLDTGAMYRAIGLKALRNGISCDQTENISKLLQNTHLQFENIDGVQHLFLDGEDVTTAIRQPEISQMASDISAVPEVRYALVELQRKLAKEHDTVLDGRDIGTYVLPDADVKIYLTASIEERAQRRYKEMIAKGLDVNYDTVRADIEKRDYNDSHRALAPLKKAEDAIEVDTTGLSVLEVSEKILSISGRNIS